MVPAPPNSQSNIPFLTARQEARASPATTTELLLITGAVAIHIAFAALTPKNGGLRKKRPRHPAFSRFVIVIAIIVTLCAVCLALAALILGWLGVISLDAVAAVVFVLAPAFLSIPLEILSYWKNSVTTHMMWKDISLNIPTFRYIRFIERHEVQKKTMTSSHSHDQLVPNLSQWAGGGHIMVLRYMRKPSSSGFACRFFANLFRIPQRESRQNTPLQPQDIVLNHIYGRQKAIYKNFATYEDTEDGITSWWWSGVSSARHLVANPDIVHLSGKQRVVNALALLSDIISIGDLVLHFYMDAFDWMLHHDQAVQTAVTSAAGFTCNRMLKELEMDGWDSVGPDVLSDAFRVSKASSQRYTILFLILAEKSQQFFNRQVYSGQTVLDELWNARDAENFSVTAKDCVKKWLEGWSLRDIDAVKKVSTSPQSLITQEPPKGGDSSSSG